MITLKLRIILLVISLLVLFYVVHKIRKSKLEIADSIYWVIFACILLLLRTVNAKKSRNITFYMIFRDG